MRPVIEGIWLHSEVLNDTYSLDDLLDAHEMLDIRLENEIRAEKAKAKQ